MNNTRNNNGNIEKHNIQRVHKFDKKRTNTTALRPKESQTQQNYSKRSNQHILYACTHSQNIAIFREKAKALNKFYSHGRRIVCGIQFFSLNIFHLCRHMHRIHLYWFSIHFYPPYASVLHPLACSRQNFICTIYAPAIIRRERERENDLERFSFIKFDWCDWIRHAIDSALWEKEKKRNDEWWIATVAPLQVNQLYPNKNHAYNNTRTSNEL